MGTANVPLHGDFSLMLFSSLLFFACITWSVSHFIAALAAPIRIPGLQGGFGHPSSGSLIFFSHIATQPLSEWQQAWRQPANDVESKYLTNLVDEAHNLAERTSFKYWQTREGAAVFMLSLAFLGSSAALVAAAAASRGSTVLITPWIALALSIPFCIVSGVQVSATYRDQSLSAEARTLAKAGDRAAQEVRNSALTLKRLPYAFAVYILAIAVPPERAGWRILGFMVATVVILISVIVTKPRWSPSKGRGPSRWRAAWWGVLFVVLAGTLLGIGGVAQLMAGPAIASLLTVGVNRYTSYMRERRVS